MTVLAVTIDDRPVLGPPRAAAGDWAALRRVLAEAVLLQDEAELLLRRLPERPDPSEVARPFGRLKGRFADLRTALPDPGDPELDGHVAVARQVLDHHLLLLHTAQQLLSGAQKCAALDERLDDAGGLGAPAERLEELRRVVSLPAGR